MANEQDRKQDPATESDISKAQAAQQPPQAESGQFETGQEGPQGDTLAEQRTDVEGAARTTPETGEEESGFVSSKGEKDTSSELVDEQDNEETREGE